jgi:hypothetical protein
MVERLPIRRISMRIQFLVDQTPCEFYRDWAFGSAELRFYGGVIKLQSALDPGTHVSLRLLRTWECRLGWRTIRIEKRRPLLFAGFRPSDFRVFVDGYLVAATRGF